MLFFYDTQTATTQLLKYERIAVLIEKLEALKLNNEEAKIVIKNIYSGLSDITSHTSNNFLIFDVNISVEIKRALLAAAPCLLLSLLFIPRYLKGEKDSANVVGGTIVVSIIIGGITYLIPIGWGFYPPIITINILVFSLLYVVGIAQKSEGQSKP